MVNEELKKKAEETLKTNGPITKEMAMLLCQEAYREGQIDLITAMETASERIPDPITKIMVLSICTHVASTLSKVWNERDAEAAAAENPV